MSDLRYGRSGIHFHHFWLKDRNGCTDRLTRDSGQENRQARPSLCTCLRPRSEAHRGRSRLASNVRKLLFRIDLSDFRRSSRPDYSRSPGNSIRGKIAKRFHAHGKMGSSGPRWALSSRVLNPLFRFRSRHYRSISRFARAPSNCLGLPASARNVCSDYEGLTPSESWLGLVTAALQRSR